MDGAGVLVLCPWRPATSLLAAPAEVSVLLSRTYVERQLSVCSILKDDVDLDCRKADVGIWFMFATLANFSPEGQKSVQQFLEPRKSARLVILGPFVLATRHI